MAQDTTSVQLTRATCIAGARVESGTVLQVGNGLAAELITANRAVRHAAPPPKPAVAPEAAADPAIDIPEPPKPAKVKS